MQKLERITINFQFFGYYNLSLNYLNFISLIIGFLLVTTLHIIGYLFIIVKGIVIRRNSLFLAKIFPKSWSFRWNCEGEEKAWAPDSGTYSHQFSRVYAFNFACHFTCDKNLQFDGQNAYIVYGILNCINPINYFVFLT